MKKLSILFFSIFIIGLNAFAQNLIPHQNEKGKWGYIDDAGQVILKYNYNYASAFVDGRAKVRKGNKWGYIDATGKEVIKIKYSEMRTWDGNYCKVAIGGKVEDGMLVSGGKWGYINRAGDIVLKCEYDEIGSFKDGLAHICKAGKYGYIDTNYQIFIPVKYSAIGSFNEQGYCWVNDGGKFDTTNNKLVVGGKFGVYNRRGELIIPAKYKMIGTFTGKPLDANPLIAKFTNSEEYITKTKNNLKEAWKNRNKKADNNIFTGDNTFDFSDGERYASNAQNALINSFQESMTKEDAIIMSECERFNLLTYTFIKPEKFSTINMPINTYFAVSNNYNAAMQFDFRTSRTKKHDKIGIISGVGEILLAPGKYPIAYFAEGDFIPVAKENKNKLQVNYHNTKTGKLLMKKWLDTWAVTPFNNGVAVIANENNQYLIDINGNKVSSEYEYILPPVDNIYIVKKGTYGLIDNSGKEVISPSFNIIYPIKEQVMCAQKEVNGTFGYLDNTGNYVIPSKYLNARSFNNGVAIVKDTNGWGEIDHNDSVIIKCEWADIKPRTTPNTQYQWVQKEGLWHNLDIKNNKIISKGYINAINFNENDIAFVYEQSGLIGAVNLADELIIPCRLSNLERAEECYKSMIEQNKTSLHEVDVYRYNLMFDDTRNQFRLTEKVTENLWDF